MRLSRDGPRGYVVIAAEIIEDLQAALDQFALVAADLAVEG
jgi:hypothetical protein